METNSRPAWVLKPTYQATIDLMTNAIILPMGSSNDFDIRTPLQQFSKHSGMGQIKFVACILPDLLKFIELHRVVRSEPFISSCYVSFMQHLAEVLCLLMSPITRAPHKNRDDDKSSLHAKVLEFLSVYEGLFPESEAHYIVHELAELPLFIEHFGPIKGWWSLSGERMLSKLKQFSCTGGRAFMKSIWKRYFEYDFARVTSFLSSFSDGDHFQNYVLDDEGEEGEGEEVICDPFEYKLFDAQKGKRQRNDTSKDNKGDKGEKMSDYEFEMLLSELISEVELHFNTAVDEAREASILYFAFCVYSEFPYKKEFHVWILKLQHDEDVKQYMLDNYDEECFHQLVELSNQLREVSKLRGLEVFKRAHVGGIKMSSRGRDCVETGLVFNDRRYGQQDVFYALKNKKNCVRTFWPNRAHSSSWCTLETTVKATRGRKKLSCAAQVNYFMRLNLPIDEFLNGLCLASVTCRPYKRTDIKLIQVCYSTANDANRFALHVHNKLFVRLLFPQVVLFPQG
eukprot:scaffold1333_cov326-Ochromonas_danica.AAC.1